MKKAFKFILYIILIIAIILVVAWLRMKKSAEENGTQAPTFRQFLGLGSATPAQNQETPGTGLTADFTEPGTTGETTGTNTGSTVSSQFTSGPLSPTENTGPNQGQIRNPGSNSGGSSSIPGPGGLPGSGGTGSGSGLPGPTTGGGPSALPGPTAPNPFSQCTDADLTIQFTSEEIDRLNALQNRFYALSGLLHTDEDVKNEVANHIEFKSKVDQITELYNYCAGKSPNINAPMYATRTSTPYWREATRDGVGYMSGRINGWDWIQLDSRKWDPRVREAPLSRAAIEQIFKVNLW